MERKRKRLPGGGGGGAEPAAAATSTERAVLGHNDLGIPIAMTVILGLIAGPPLLKLVGIDVASMPTWGKGLAIGALVLVVLGGFALDQARWSNVDLPDGEERTDGRDGEAGNVP